MRTTVKVTFDKAYVKADGTKYALNLASGTQVLNLSYTASPAHDEHSGESDFARSKALVDQVIWLWTTGSGEASRADG